MSPTIPLARLFQPNIPLCVSIIIVKNGSDIYESIETLTMVLVAGMSTMTLDDDIAPRGDWLLSELSEKHRRQVISERTIPFVARGVGWGATQNRQNHGFQRQLTHKVPRFPHKSGFHVF